MEKAPEKTGFAFDTEGERRNASAIPLKHHIRQKREYSHFVLISGGKIRS